MPESVRVYFDTMLYINKFEDVFKIRPETNNIFSKVKSDVVAFIIYLIPLVCIIGGMTVTLIDVPFEERLISPNDNVSNMFGVAIAFTCGICIYNMIMYGGNIFSKENKQYKQH